MNTEKISLIRLILTYIAGFISLGIVLSFLFQSPKASGLGAIGGSATTFKVRKRRDAFLEVLLVVFSIMFIVATLLLTVIKPPK